MATALLRRHEGLRLKPYRDTRGHLTIGWGRCLDTRGISPDEADHLLLNDLAAAEQAAVAYVGESVWQELRPARQAALLDLAHQLGARGLAGFVIMRDALACSAWETAAAELLDSRLAEQTPGRARRVAEVLRTGEMPAGMG